MAQGRVKLVTLLAIFVFMFLIGLMNLHSALPQEDPRPRDVIRAESRKQFLPPPTPGPLVSTDSEEGGATPLPTTKRPKRTKAPRFAFLFPTSGPSLAPVKAATKHSDPDVPYHGNLLTHYSNDVWKIVPRTTAEHNHEEPQGHFVPRDSTVYTNMKHTDIFEHEDIGDFSAVSGGVESVIGFGNRSTTHTADNMLSFTWEMSLIKFASIECTTKSDGGFNAILKFPFHVNLYGAALRAQESGIVIQPQRTLRLFNRDIFRHKLDDELGLYGSVPLLYVCNRTAPFCFGIFWLNAADTHVRTFDDRVEINADAGGVEWFLIPGPTQGEVLRRYMHLTGLFPLPPLFSLGYHQCRWSYNDAQDILQVSGELLRRGIPTDTMWLDIDHTDDKRYFTWDLSKYPDPEGLQRTLWNGPGRRLVTITDPHIKVDRGYHVYHDGYALGAFVKREYGNTDFEGHCWPGNSVWVDFTNPRIREWYAGLFSFSSYKHSTPTLFSWIDMNEPSVLSGPEVTLPKDTLHAHGVRHKEVHNAYGFYHAMATHLGQTKRTNGIDRPFVLTRSFFAGSQRYAAVWTGDNQAKWEYLKASISMVLTLSMCGIPHVGADVGGFF
eukprot:PhF_6_TR36566/c0_g1_i2/m.54003/K12317/GANC; neutral alpha-glucosidase C